MFCPNCGHQLVLLGTRNDVATYHETMKCTNKPCGVRWMATYQKGIHEELLHIAPMAEEDYE